MRIGILGIVEAVRKDIMRGKVNFVANMNLHCVELNVVMARSQKKWPGRSASWTGRDVTFGNAWGGRGDNTLKTFIRLVEGV